MKVFQLNSFYNVQDISGSNFNVRRKMENTKCILYIYIFIKYNILLFLVLYHHKLCQFYTQIFKFTSRCRKEMNKKFLKVICRHLINNGRPLISFLIQIPFTGIKYI